MHIDTQITDALVQAYASGRYGKTRYLKPNPSSEKSVKQQTNTSALSTKRK